MYDLRPPSLDELGLIQALCEQTERYNHGRLRITIEAPELLPPLAAAVEVATYRIVQVAMTNVVRHSQACNGEREGNDVQQIETLSHSEKSSL